VSKPLILFGPLPPPYGGVSVFLSTLFAHLRHADVRLWSYFGRESDDELVKRFKHRQLGVIPLLLRQGPNARIVDFSHFHLEYPHPILLPIWLSAKLLVKFYWYKYVLDGSLPSRYPSFTPLQRTLFRRAIAAVDEFIVVSPELAGWLKDEIKVRQKVSVIPCLLNIPQELMVRRLAAETESALRPFLKHHKKVCSIGTFIPTYGFAQVANAVERVRNEVGADIGLLLLDGAFAADGDYREEVLRNREWITVLTNVPNEQVYQVLKQCDLFVRAFGAESYGISRVEAVWCDVPVVATNVGETRGMLTYQFGDADKLSELIGQVLESVNSGNHKAAAEVFRAEADQNLQKFVATVKLSIDKNGK
jgi:glycosyltransferase involved in cell wall biosynthesis